MFLLTDMRINKGRRTQHNFSVEQMHCEEKEEIWLFRFGWGELVKEWNKK